MQLQSLYQKAMKFAGEKHCNQKVPGSKANYLLHISNVAMEVLVAYYSKPDFDIKLAIQIAILHDTLEDTDTSFDELKSTFSSEVAEGVSALTKNSKFATKQERMQDSLNRIKSSYKEVAIVKLADRITNLQPPPKHWSEEKVNKYREEARLIFTELNGVNDYLETRIQSQINQYSINKK